MTRLEREVTGDSRGNYGYRFALFLISNSTFSELPENKQLMDTSVLNSS